MLQRAEFASVMQDADHVDVKVVEGDVSLRQFLASMFTYQPTWVTFLYRVRQGFVRFLGMRQKGMPHAIHITPEAVPIEAGEALSFFKTLMAREDDYWFAETSDKHLTAVLGVVAEPLMGTRQRFHVITIVHYHNWAGPVYFNVIRPFHHLVVGRMAKAGIKPVSATTSPRTNHSARTV